METCQVELKSKVICLMNLSFILKWPLILELASVLFVANLVKLTNQKCQPTQKRHFSDMVLDYSVRLVMIVTILTIRFEVSGAIKHYKWKNHFDLGKVTSHSFCSCCISFGAFSLKYEMIQNNRIFRYLDCSGRDSTDSKSCFFGICLDLFWTLKSFAAW